MDPLVPRMRYNLHVCSAIEECKEYQEFALSGEHLRRLSVHDKGSSVVARASHQWFRSNDGRAYVIRKKGNHTCITAHSLDAGPGERKHEPVNSHACNP